ncbi:MAG: hypothetical protein UY48_C0015G0002 [Candidatus Gottesmanbacteria bacterium GW2011_GWB1_49_7]|uniref:LytR/CpsA/Psr regulator C-terminal domain-containing protein n=1 Tax=Candidatus Gottesmanbacteria bacterium GW2011_GWB1_49_7 TaxID=1618448 RepID=A0A0G1VYR7_9BACT|nr:MAG: hypothetical protein UY49_C0014G0003 [Microgenomates group bacterium GW2011_GWC1_49_7]KKW11596.1 MAG: hypothetical protein UY48_C0015G0002 [Candidatus Gottesmanbacteria bacterium GW2011_GWB1_49_7]
MRRRRQTNILFPLAGIVLVVLALVWAFFPRPGAYPRQTLVLVGSPMVIFSWDSRDRALTLVSLPADVAAEGTHGYGTYSLEAFWRLGEIDKKDGTVLAESVSEALGLPIDGYIGPKSGLATHEADALTFAKQIFSPRNVVSYVGGQYRTNISLRSFVGLTWMLQVTKSERVIPQDFSRQPGAVAEDRILADGSHQWTLDAQALDTRLKGVFEDERVRREGVTVAVYNTTDMPSLGERAARLLTHIGVSVVSVGNDAPEVSACTVSGTKQTLTTVSAQVLESILGCVPIEVTEADRADLIVWIGKAYAKRFVPN